MSDIIEVDPTSITHLSEEMANASDAIDTQMSQLTSELNYLMTQWSGEAANAYLSAQSEWNSSMASMHSILLEVVGLLNRISGTYQTTEAAVVRAATA